MEEVDPLPSKTGDIAAAAARLPGCHRRKKSLDGNKKKGEFERHVQNHINVWQNINRCVFGGNLATLAPQQQHPGDSETREERYMKKEIRKSLHVAEENK